MTDRDAKHSSENNDHMTPGYILEAVRSLFGDRIWLDPASSEAANQFVGAAHYYDAAANGFNRQWLAPNVFLNPPGGKCDPDGRALIKAPKDHLASYLYEDGTVCTRPAKSSTRMWWEKLTREWSEGRVGEAVFVGFNMEVLQSTQVCPHACLDFPLCIPKERIKFNRIEGGKLVQGKSPTHGNCLIYLPLRGVRVADRVADFKRIFTSIGLCKF